MDKVTWFEPGFGLRERDGKKRFVVRYRIGKQQRLMTLGRGLDKKGAAKEAKKILGDVARGIDPQGEKKAARTASVIGSFKDVAEQFHAHLKETRRDDTIYRGKLYLLGYAKPLHALKIDEVKRSHIAVALAAIAKQHGNVSADRARATLSSMFAWAIKEGLCGDDFANPVTDTNTRSETKARDRVLDDAEVAAIWNACGDDDFSHIVKLLLLTACRRDEIASLRWEEIEDGKIVILGERTKNGRAFEVPLSRAAKDILTPRAGSGCFVFGRRGTGFSGFSKSKAELDAKLTGVKPWRLHDLRRTAATRMADIGVQPHIIEAALNHISGHKAGVAGIYNRAAYAAEKRDALERWAKRIAVITGKNVTDISKHRKRRKAS